MINKQRIRTTVSDVLLRLSQGSAMNEPSSDGTIELVASEDSSKPILLKSSLESLTELSQTALLAKPAVFPISSACYVFDSEFFGDLLPDSAEVIGAEDEGLARLGAYLSVGELFTYLNEDKNTGPSPIAALYSRTFSYCLARSSLLWGVKRSRKLFERWINLRDILGWAPVRALPPERVREIVSQWLQPLPEGRWTDQISRLRIAEPASVLEPIAHFVSDILGLSLTPPPKAFDSRFEWLNMVAARLRAVESDTKGTGSYALGLLLAATEPGELMHLNWLRAHLKYFPEAGIHYAAWSAYLTTDRGVQFDVLRGLIRRLTRDLQRPLRLQDSPQVDASWIDLLSAKRQLDDSQLRANHRNFVVSIVPGVEIAAAFVPGSEQSKPTANNDRPNPVAQRNTPIHQPSLFIASTANDDTSNARILYELRELRGHVDLLLETKKKTRPSRKE